MPDRWVRLSGEDCYLRLRTKPSGHRVLYLSRDAIRRLAATVRTHDRAGRDTLHVTLDRNADDPAEISVRAVDTRYEYGAKVDMVKQLAPANRISELADTHELPWIVDLTPDGTRLVGRLDAPRQDPPAQAAVITHGPPAEHEDTDYAEDTDMDSWDDDGYYD